MGLFDKKEGGLMDVIRCDEPTYLIWKWRPAGQEANSTKKENAIRYGSSLRVKDGEIAVFVYPQKDGTMQDFIEGPFDETIKSANFPVLASIVGTAFGGASPFQAEIYFINIAGIQQVKFGVPYFDVFDPRFLDFGVPVSVRGTITFKLVDYKAFIKLHRLINFDLDAFKNQIKDAVSRYVKTAVTNAPKDNGIPVMQIETKIEEINELVQGKIKPRLQDEFGVVVSSVDIGAIETDRDSEGWKQLKAVTVDLNTTNMQEMQRINLKGAELQVEGSNLAAHQLNQQTKVAMAGAEALGQMGKSGAMDMGQGGMNPAGMMAGMVMGGAVGGQMAGMMNNAMQGVQQPGSMPPPPPVVQYNIAVNGQTTGPFDINSLAKMVQSGQLTQQSQVWKQGMSGWVAAGTVQELSGLFAQTAPPPPPAP